jgi:hypothetical protein
MRTEKGSAFVPRGRLVCSNGEMDSIPSVVRVTLFNTATAYSFTELIFAAILLWYSGILGAKPVT